MGKTLEALRRLQDVERQLGELRREEQARRRQIEVCGRQLQKLDQDLESKHDELRRHDAEIHNIELEVNAREEIVRRHRIALSQAKTNKEYAAILSTINIEKADASKLESRVLEMMSAKDGLQSIHEESVAEREKIRARQAQAEEKLAAYLDRTRGELETLTQERDEAGDALPPSIRGAFDRAAERLDGDVLAPVVRAHPKRDEWVCGGCNMAVTLETVNSLRTRDEVVSCSICGRILVPQS